MDVLQSVEQTTFLTNKQARDAYDLRLTGDIPATQIEMDLLTVGITSFDMDIPSSDFAEMLDLFEVCIEECPEALAETYHDVDERFGNDAGHVRKDTKVVDGIQTQDGKDLIHFTESARLRWDEQFKHGPKQLVEFLACGYEVHDRMIVIARTVIGSMEATHPNIPKAYFLEDEPDRLKQSLSFMRAVSYDSYDPEQVEASTQVAKPHFDIGGFTIHGHADDDGFYAETHGGGGKQYFSTLEGQGYAFSGVGNQVLYDDQSPMQPMKHGVDRTDSGIIMPNGMVPRRRAVVAFIDCPQVDHGVTIDKTLPDIFGAQQEQAA